MTNKLFLYPFLFIVPWGELDQTIVQDMVNYVRSVMSFGEGGEEIHPPGGAVILKRIKRYYRSQRHQAQVKSSQERRRRQRLLNRRNRLTMVRYQYLNSIHLNCILI